MIAARSTHPGGVCAFFCDGHTAFMKDTISIAVRRALSTTRGDGVATDSELCRARVSFKFIPSVRKP
jgi:hypothetical protein